MLFGKKKKEEPHKGDVLLAQGIYLRPPVMDNGHLVLNCFLRSLIVFLLVFGSIGGFLSALDISYNYLLVIVLYLVLSMYFSFLYAAPKFLYRDLGYILFFAVFLGAIYLFRIYANSGFYVIINAVLSRAQAYFDLAGVREYEVQIDNEYLTVAIVSIFVGMVMIIILNIWIYSTMSIIWTVLLTFPLQFIPLYMKLNPDAIYIIALSIGYLAVIIFKANGHYLAFAWDAPFHVRGLKKDRITYTQDAGIFRQVLLSLLVMLFCLVIVVQSVFPARAFEGSFKNDRLREKTSDTIANFVLLGFAGMFNRYPSTGGMSGGQLGGISNVRPDYQPDLIVSYTPYSNEAIYLKGYTGGAYGDNCWESIYQETEAGREAEIFEEESLRKEGLALQQEVVSGGDYSAYGVMDVRNVGADPAYLYYPYYTLFDDYSIYTNHSLMSSAQGLGYQKENKYSYYPKVVWEEELGETLPEQIDTTQVDEVYLQVPDKNKQVIEEECRKIGLNSEMTENEIVEKVRDYFADNIPYTLKPGSTPRGEDFVNYFLTRNRKGYCAHFASAATLLFREMGIPARYIEGYAFSLETALASDENTQKEYGEYYWGYSAIGRSTVLDVEVTDAMAHAWVEIYVEGFGWKVVEVTPGSAEVTDEDDFWSAFSEFLNGAADSDGNDTNMGDLNLSRFTWLVDVVLAVSGFIVFIYIIRMLVRKAVRFARCHQKDRKEALIARYADVCDRIRLCDKGFDACRSHSEQMLYMSARYCAIDNRDQLCEYLETVSFSPAEMPEEVLQALADMIVQVRKAIWKKETWRNRIKLCKR